MRNTALAVSLGLFIACDPSTKNPGSQIGSETSGCQVQSEEPVTDLSAVADGFSMSAQEALDGTLGDFDGTLTLEAGGTEALVFDLAQAGDVVVQRMAWESAGDIEPAFECADVYAIPVALTLQAGALLDEVLDATVTVDTEGLGGVFVSVEYDALVGDAEPSTFDPATMAEVWLNLGAERGEAGWSGELSFLGESHPQGSGDDAAISATNDPLGSFEVAAAE
ncbi:MAG: hypothetical protein H6739_11160 [Alphaproteobacteria bacterium]|nr:hypothetical protein [Alphaproteobacteria bacterium]